MTTTRPDAITYCGYCGQLVSDDSAAPERFGQQFCSEAHAEEFAAGVRASRMQAAGSTETADTSATHAGGCALPPSGQRNWKDYLKRAACWGAPLLLLIAVPLFWNGGWAATGGSFLSVVALLACPVSMYFMMRGMMNMPPHDGKSERASEERRA